MASMVDFPTALAGAPVRRRRLAVIVALGAVTFLAMLGPLAEDASARSRRASRPPNVALHPDRGMGFTRFSKTGHDQKLLNPLNQGTKLPGIDPGIDPYKLGPKPSTFDIQTGLIRGSLTDQRQDLRRAGDAARRLSQQSSRRSSSRLPDSSALPSTRSLLTTTQRNLARTPDAK